MNFARVAIDNISKFGDTDIFPYPIENAMFFDSPESVEKDILEIEKDFDFWISKYPVDSIQSCIPVGYTGYRWATLIDPLWNAFLLYQVLKISDKIESARIPVEKNSVFSYRLNIDEEKGSLFNKEVNWRKFYETSVAEAEASESIYVIRFDISDFYNRIYHHRLENAIIRIGADPEVKKRIMSILQDISNNDSYGLPVGGNASRILAELLLNSMDQLMTSRKIRFFRFVDDYILFADSREDAYKKLNWCVEYMLRNWGLTLQKSKTQIQSKSEFVSQAKATLEGEENAENKEKSDFMRIHIHYDPYSLTADEDYKKLQDQLEGFDINQLIIDEIRKSRIHLALGKQLMSAVLYLEGEKLNLAVRAIFSNLETLYPVIPNVLRVLKQKVFELDDETLDFLLTSIEKYVEEDSYLFQSENNSSYLVRLLSQVNSEKTIQIINTIHSRTEYELVRTNCIYAMANIDNHYWIADQRTRFATFSSWRRRAFIVASYFLRDEGKHWRDHTKAQFTDFEIQIRDWVSKKDILKGWKIPL